MKRSPMKRTAFVSKPKSIGKSKARPALKTKQRPVTSEEKSIWDQLASKVGCIACRLDGVINNYVSIHHIDGRTKEGCHKLVLPLCASHHQDGSGNNKAAIAVHPWKKRFEKMYGNQLALLNTCMQMIAPQKEKPGISTN